MERTNSLFGINAADGFAGGAKNHRLTRGHPSRLAVKNGEHLRMTAKVL
jgi:hypothetical protein